jgi:hypothetical protein
MSVSLLYTPPRVSNSEGGRRETKANSNVHAGDSAGSGSGTVLGRYGSGGQEFLCITERGLLDPCGEFLASSRCELADLGLES